MLQYKIKVSVSTEKDEKDIDNYGYWLEVELIRNEKRTCDRH